MKTNYIKGISALCITTLLFFSSCLKDDSHTFSPEAVQSSIVEIPLSGLANFSSAAITAGGPLDTVMFVVNVASASVPTVATTVTVGIDNSIVTTYNAANPAIIYNVMPAGSFVFKDVTLTIPAGSRESSPLSVIVDKSKIDPTLSYMLPIRIKTSSGTTISGNFSIMYYHIIGNDFAGTYKWDFTRTPAAGNFVGHTTTVFPVSPTQVEVAGGYYTGTVRYEVTFTKTVTGTAATYSNFQVVINQDDITNIFAPNGISVTSPAVIVSPAPVANYTSTTQLTFAQALTLFHFQYSVLGSSGGRVNNDYYYK